MRLATCTCQGDIVIGGLSVGISGSEVGRVVLAERRPEAREYLDDPRAGAESTPKPSRIKAVLWALWNTGKDVTEFAANLKQTTAAFGIDPRSFL